MTRAQLIHLQAELWPNACETQGWRKDDRDRRLSVCGAAIGRKITSTNEIDDNQEFTLVKARLLRLADDLRGTLEDGDLRPNAARMRREKVRRQVACIALYPSESPRGKEAAETYVKTIVRDMAWRAGYEPESYDEATLDAILETLAYEHLDRLVKTLDNRLHNRKFGMRVRAGHTLHDMFTGAGLPCHCTICEPRKPQKENCPF